MLEQGPRGDGQAHGRAERAVRSVEELVRLQLADLEERIDDTLDVHGNLFGWLVKHATDLGNKRLASKDGATPWERLRGRPYRGQLLRFGAPVMHRLVGKPVGGVLMNRWSPGSWVGKSPLTDEHLVALPTGQVIRCRAVRELDEQVRMMDLRRIIPVHPPMQ